MVWGVAYATANDQLIAFHVIQAFSFGSISATQLLFPFLVIKFLMFRILLSDTVKIATGFWGFGVSSKLYYN